MILTAEEKRQQESRERKVHRKRWGPYLSERAWGTVREDYIDRTTDESKPYISVRMRPLVQHLGDRGDEPQRRRQLFKGETKRQRLGIPMLMGKLIE